MYILRYLLSRVWQSR